MATVKEIRVINHEPYYCTVDYSKNKYGDIISINKRIVTRFNRDTPAEFKDGKITNIIDETKETKDETKDEIENKDDMEENEVYMADNMERIINEVLERRENEKRMKDEIAETKQRLDGLDGVLDSKLGGFVDNLSTKIGGLESKIVSQKLSNLASDEAAARKQYELTHKKNMDDLIDCPGCKKDGHTHKLKKTENGTMKCEGKECGEEFLLAPKESDSYCSTCGFPLDSKIQYDDCPMCHGKDAKWRDKKE